MPQPGWVAGGGEGKGRGGLPVWFLLDENEGRKMTSSASLQVNLFRRLVCSQLKPMLADVCVSACACECVCVCACVCVRVRARERLRERVTERETEKEDD
jgi:hypothetical protein